MNSETQPSFSPTMFVAVTDHSDDDEYHEWVDLGLKYTNAAIHGQYEVRLDALGRNHPHAWRRWRLLVCNNTDCPGRARYRSDLIDQAAAAWEESRHA